LIYIGCIHIWIYYWSWENITKVLILKLPVRLQYVISCLFTVYVLNILWH
jgi:hypothetical protein